MSVVVARGIIPAFCDEVAVPFTLDFLLCRNAGSAVLGDVLVEPLRVGLMNSPSRRSLGLDMVACFRDVGNAWIMPVRGASFVLVVEVYCVLARRWIIYRYMIPSLWRREQHMRLSKQKQYVGMCETVLHCLGIYCLLHRILLDGREVR